jgi:hypothetical protein
LNGCATAVVAIAREATMNAALRMLDCMTRTPSQPPESTLRWCVGCARASVAACAARNREDDCLFRIVAVYTESVTASSRCRRRGPSGARAAPHAAPCRRE